MSSGGFGIGVVECSNLHSGKLVVVTDVIVLVMSHFGIIECFVFRLSLYNSLNCQRHPVTVLYICN